MLNKAPAILCSWGKANFAINNDPAGNTKSMPTTEIHRAGNSRAQYDTDGLLIANRRIAMLVDNVPAPETLINGLELSERLPAYGPKSQTIGIYAAINPIKILQSKPEENRGKVRTTFCIGEYFL